MFDYGLDLNNDRKCLQCNNLTVDLDLSNEVQDSQDNISEFAIYGDNIKNNSVPSQTLFDGNRYSPVLFKNNNTKGFGLTQSILSKHLMLIGGIGCGKTNVFNIMIDSIIKQMTDNDVMLIFDTKGDFKNRFFDKNNPNHILIGNAAEYRNITKNWNIFNEMKNDSGYFEKEESELIAKEISKELFEGRDSSTQPFFSMAATDTVAKVLISFMRVATRKNTENKLTTSSFVNYISKAGPDTFYKIMSASGNEDFANAKSYFGKPNSNGSVNKQGQGVAAYISSMVNDLFVGIFKNTYPNGDFSMRDIIKNKGRKVVFIEYDLSLGETLGPMYRILFDLALKEALGGRSSNRGNVYLMIDEFKLLPNLMHIDDALNFGRSLGIKVFAGIQNINQLYSIYGEERGKTIAAGFTNCFCFTTSDADTRQFVVEKFGETYEGISFNYGMNNASIEPRVAHTVEDWQIRELKVGEAFVNISGYKPFKFKFDLI